MRCYAFADGLVTSGLQTTRDAKLGTVVFLGSRKRNRRFTNLVLGRNNPATVQDGKIFEALPVELRARGSDFTFHALVRADGQAGGCALLRVNTRAGTRSPSAEGRWRVLRGDVRSLQHAFGSTQGLMWADDFLCLARGAVILIECTDGTKWIVHYPQETGLQCMSLEEAQAFHPKAATL